MIQFAIITAKRKIPTLSRCILSLRQAGYSGQLDVFAEPDADAQCANLHVARNNMGALGNFNRALMWLVDNATSEYVCVLNDDLEFHKKAFDYIDIEKAFGYLCLFTQEQDIRHEDRQQQGWIRLWSGVNTWGAGFVMHKVVAERLLVHPFYLERLRTSPMKGIDAAVSESLLRMELPMYAHNPSICEHIGEKSAILGRQDWPNKGHCAFNFSKWK